MGWNLLQDKQKITTIIECLVSKKIEIKVRIPEEKEPFTSTVLKHDQGELNSKTATRAHLIIEKLAPPKGNPLIQLTQTLTLEFVVSENQCRCPVKYLGISNAPPFFGFMLSFPEAVEIQDRRQEERIPFEFPEFVSVEFNVRDLAGNEKRYSLTLIDSSVHGLGVLITPRDSELLGLLKPGDRILHMTFYARTAMIKVDGTVRHITKIEEGKHQGSYILGIHSKDIIESSQRRIS